MNTTTLLQEGLQTLPDIGYTITSEQASLLAQYLDHLDAFNQRQNLTACRDTPSQISNLLLPSMECFPLLQHYTWMVDLGAGAGPLGISHRILSPQQTIHLVERSQKKADFLEWVCKRLQLDRIRIHAQPFDRLPLPEDCHGAIVCRGAAPLSQQLALTQTWRQQGIGLYSLQTQSSMQQFTGPSPTTLHTLHSQSGQQPMVLAHFT